MPPRPPINPEGWYHVGSRGCYGQTLYDDRFEHEVFLRMYARVSSKYGWQTPAWALMKNHHHFVVQLVDGGLSEGLRELHGGYSRWRHAQYGQTRQGHLFRHGFFARELHTTDDVIGACAYVDLNPTAKRKTFSIRRNDWCGNAATLGLVHPRVFHTPTVLLELLGERPAEARSAYRQLLQLEHVRRRQVQSPNDGD